MPSSARTTAAPAAPALRRLMLVPTDSPRSPAGVRRFRLARRRLEDRAVAGPEPAGLMRRSFD